MTDCARCGCCCDPVIVPFDPQELAAECLADPELGPRTRQNAEFMRDHWTSQSTFVDANGVTAHRVRCDAFDTDSRLCAAHDNRPPICRDFPWYGKPQDQWASTPQAGALLPQCSYNADVRIMLPIVEVT